jgi:RecA/RadA recombinase
MILGEAKDTSDLVKSIIRNKVGWFELSCLKVILETPEVAQRVYPVLCMHPDPKRGFMGDFTNPTYNSFYHVLWQYYKNLQAFETKPGKNVFCLFAERISQDGGFVVEGEEDILADLYDQLEAIRLEDVKHVVCEGLLHWILTRRKAKAIEDSAYDDDPDAARELMESYSRPVKEQTEEDYGFHFGHGVENELLDVVRIPTGLASLDKRLGGGLGYTEYALGIACQGRGKTVLATQFLASMGGAGYKGILITTEQPHEQLEPRIISSQARIPFDLIKDKVRKEALSIDQWHQYEELRDRLRGNVMIIDWNRRHSLTVISDLEDEVKRRRDQLGGLDFVILDWLGGNLGAQGMNPDMKRALMKDASDHMGALADRHNLATLGWAQVNMKQGANKKKLGAQHISENKQLGEKAATVFGVSSLIAGEENPDDLAFKKDQFIYIEKARKSIGGLVPVRCEFDYQRIVGR